MGHLTLISEDVITALAIFPPELSSVLSQHAPQPQWDSYISGRFRETKDRDSSQLGGGKPLVTPGQIASGGFGTHAAAVDEADSISPPSGTPPNSTLTTSAPIGASPGGRRQNVIFSAINEDEEEELHWRNASVPTGSDDVRCIFFESLSSSRRLTLPLAIVYPIS
jgi:hypothetical protein